MSLANLVGHVLDGKYRIERELGKGGMGAVYLATHLGTERPVAIKVIMPQFTRNEEFVERFRREAKAAGRMRHPNVVDVTDFGFAAVDNNQIAYLVMEYLDGCTLADILAEENQLPVDWVVDILEQVSSAVDEAHQAGTIHRDLKPENIWLEPNRRGGYTVKVLDFGLAKQGDPIKPAGDPTSPSVSNDTAALPSASCRFTGVETARDTNVLDQRTPTLPPTLATTQAITPDAAATQALSLNEEATTRIIAPESEATATNLLPFDSGEAATLVQSPANREATTQVMPPVASPSTAASASEANEAATMIQHVASETATAQSADEETRTRIFVESSTSAAPLTGDDDIATIVLPPDGDSATHGLSPSVGRKTTDASGARPTADEYKGSTAPAGGITRIGAILGTPLYMSPEQCRGEALDARSDIYSLGIIAYQMLAGSAPFTGDINDVLRQHIEAAPPPLRERRKKIPKRMEQVIMSALAKNPDDRPASALSFANALRASSEGVGTLFRHALVIYSEHFPVFFRLSLVAYMPVVLLTVLFLSNDLLIRKMVVSRLAGGIIAGVLGLVMFIAQLIATSVITGVIIWFVVQLAVAPLRPLKLRHALRALKKRLKHLTKTSFRIIITSILGLCLLVIPGVIYFINAALASAVVVMENLKGRAAVRRSKVLVKRARPTVIAVILIHFLLPFLLGSLFSAAFGLRNRHMGEGATVTVRVGELLPTLINIFILPLMATLSALVYLKVRQLGGERFNEMLNQFEAAEAPQTKWQKRMRERLNSSSSTRSA
jgi:serine/threonine protein kinase